MEKKGKEERQKGMNTVKSNHTVDDIRRISPLLTSSELLVRINPMDDESVGEINSVIEAGAQLIMLPMWKTVREVENFISIVNGRVKTVLLLETKEAVDCLDDILKMDGIDEIHIGLNDLHLSYGLTFMFELLSNGVVESVCNKIKNAGIPYGFGGIAKLGYGDLPAEKIIMEHYRLGSTRAILSRSFCDTNIVNDIGEIDNIFKENMKGLRDFENKVQCMTKDELLNNKKQMGKQVDLIVDSKKNLGIEKMKVLKEKIGESFYILDTKKFINNFLELKSEFEKYYPNFNIAYSYKTNYIPKLCKIIDTLNGYAEVVSEMELQLALKIGVNPNRIIWNGPIKDTKFLREYAISGVTINIDNYEEVLKLDKITREKNERINVGIRCNFDVDDGVISRFGVDINGKDFNDILKVIKENSNLYLINLQCHFAKRELKFWSNRVKTMIELLKRIDIIPDRIDLGGGLYGKMDGRLRKQFNCKIPSFEDYAAVVAPVFAEYFKDKKKQPKLLLEPGSALVGDCMKFVCTINNIKKIRGKTFATVTGSQKNISMVNVNPPVDIIHLANDSKEYKNVDIVGYTCIEGDIVHSGYNGCLSVGDVVVINNCGSYSIVMKPPFILPNFGIIELNNDRIEIIKHAETFDYIFETYIF